MEFKFKSRHQHRLHIELIPLIDIFLTLILFFMVSYGAGIVSSITIHLPKAMQAGTYKSGDLIISINEKNEVFANDARLDQNNLLQEFKNRKNQVKDGTVVIRGDKLTNYETIVKIMDLLNQAGIPKFTLATIKSH